MSKQMGLIANLDLCMGCFACEVACKQEHHFAEGKTGIKVVTVGPYELDGELAMDFFPMATDACDICAQRRIDGDRPFCVEVCPTKALTIEKGEALLKIFRENGRFHLCRVKKDA
jgi:Fe-S-cluster-containing dehydrogenase component